MIINLRRAVTPADMAELSCGVCSEVFEAGPVFAMAITDDHYAVGEGVCPSCVAVLGAHRPDKFPTAYELEEATRRFPEPIWRTEDEAANVRIDDRDAYEVGYERSFVSREELAGQDTWYSLAMIGDTLNDAYTTVEDLPAQAIGEERRKRVLDVLAEKRDEAWRATHRYAAAFGLRR